MLQPALLSKRLGRRHQRRRAPLSQNGMTSRDAPTTIARPLLSRFRQPRRGHTNRECRKGLNFSACYFDLLNMYSTADYSVTPRPMYPADGRKIPDVYTAPGGLRDELQAALGTFPLFEFWGPRAGIRSSEWIAAAANDRACQIRPRPRLLRITSPAVLNRRGVR